MAGLPTSINIIMIILNKHIQSLVHLLILESVYLIININNHSYFTYSLQDWIKSDLRGSPFIFLWVPCYILSTAASGELTINSGFQGICSEIEPGKTGFYGLTLLLI